MNEIKIFKLLSIGGISKETLINQLTDKCVQFNKYAHLLFEHPLFSTSGASEKVTTVKVTMNDLGISQPCSFKFIVDKAAALGLKLCPLYLGAFLRLEYLDQPESPYLTVASPKPENDESYPNGFYLRNLDGVLWLRGYCASDDYEWPLESEFIFLRQSPHS
jgi:hypothetical protein